MGKFYFTRKRAEQHRKKGQAVFRTTLKNGKTIFKVKNIKRRNSLGGLGGGIWSG